MLKGIILIVVILFFSQPFIWTCRRSAYLGRRKWSESELIVAFDSGQNAVEALSLLSKFYEVPVGFLRPDDVFTREGRLWKYDSWSFSSGQEKLNEFVWNHGMHGEHPEWTIKDFVRWYIDVVVPMKGSPEIHTHDC